MANEFPTDWKAYKLDELGFVGRGKSKHRPRNDPILYEGMYPFVQTGDVKAANFYLKDFSQTYNEIGLKQSKLWKKGTLCITIAANIAETAILDIEACFPDSIIGFVPDKSKTTSAYIKYYIDYIKLQMQQISQGTTQDNLSAEKLLSFNFIVPDITKQQKIASILSAYDDLIENNNRRIAILQEMARNLYREWFVKFRFPGHEEVKMIDSELGQIPEGWKPLKIKDIVEFVTDNTKPEKLTENLKYLPIDCLPRRSMHLQEETPLSEAQSSLILFKKDDILFGAMRPYFHKVIIAPFDGVTRKTCFILRAKMHKWAFAYLTLFQDDAIAFANQHSKGSTIPYAVWEKGLENYSVLVPDATLLEKFEHFMKPIIKQIQMNYFRNQNLKIQRDMLLPKLISGKIEV